MVTVIDIIFISFGLIMLILWDSERGMRKFYQRMWNAGEEHNKKLFDALIRQKKSRALAKKKQ